MENKEKLNKLLEELKNTIYQLFEVGIFNITIESADYLVENKLFFNIIIEKEDLNKEQLEKLINLNFYMSGGRFKKTI